MTKLFFVVTEDWYFYSHRLSLAKFAIEKGLNVTVVTQVSEYRQRIEAEGISIIPIIFRRSGKNPFSDFITIWSLYNIYRKERPDLIHHVALKPILYGSIAAKLAGMPVVINAVTGLGYIFTSTQLFAKCIKFFIKPALKYLLGSKNSYTIFQNKDDKELVCGDSELIFSTIIKGSGVNMNQYAPGKSSSSPPIIILVARMLRDKGIIEFVEAARYLKHKNIRFVLVGGLDTENPAGISSNIIEKWQQENIVEWWGKRDDVEEILKTVTIACLPSYREGLPKFLLEAASSELPIITTDVPGCREIVINNINGLLIPSKNYMALANAIVKMIDEPGLRKKFGIKGREIVTKEFSDMVVNKKTTDLYDFCLNKK